jgi:hypothetical protein
LKRGFRHPPSQIRERAITTRFNSEATAKVVAVAHIERPASYRFDDLSPTGKLARPERLELPTLGFEDIKTSS